MTRVFICLNILTSAFSLKSSAQAGFRQPGDSLLPKRLVAVLPQNFYNQHVGYVCKKENQLQKATGLNLFVRLGSKNYADYLEGKPNAAKP